MLRISWKTVTGVALACSLVACKDDPTPPTDWDGDGFAVDDDCDDRRAEVFPEADEVCDGLDNDCDGVVDEDDALDAPSWYLDYDADGYGGAIERVACEAPNGWISVTGDCDDTDATIAPGVADREPADGCQQDADGDGWADAAAEAPLVAGTDCDDTDAGVFPSADEVCDGVDTDCDGVIPDDELDADADGYVECELVESRGPVLGGDCDDTNASVSPGVAEICNEGDEVDDDCNGRAGDATDEALASTGSTFYRDADGDGFGAAPGTVVACEAPDGWVSNDRDCDDSRAVVYPGAEELCDTLANDCNGPGIPDDGLTLCPDAVVGVVDYNVVIDGRIIPSCMGDVSVTGTLSESLCPDCAFALELSHGAPAWEAERSGPYCDEADGPGTVLLGFDAAAAVWLRWEDEAWTEVYTGSAGGGSYTWTGSVSVAASDYTGGAVGYQVSGLATVEAE